MTPSDEHQLYMTDRPAWARYVAPRWAMMLRDATPARKRELWDMACPVLRAELRRIADRNVDRQTRVMTRATDPSRRTRA